MVNTRHDKYNAGSLLASMAAFCSLGRGQSHLVCSGCCAEIYQPAFAPARTCRPSFSTVSPSRVSWQTHHHETDLLGTRENVGVKPARADLVAALNFARSRFSL
jgi:hypothetical protein